MLVKINGNTLVDEQEKLFQEVSESFVKFIEEYQGKHWFKEFIYDLTDGEGFVFMDRIKAEIWYRKTRIMLLKLNLLVRIAPPDAGTANKLIDALEGLKTKLEVD